VKNGDAQHQNHFSFSGFSFCIAKNWWQVFDFID
jgi:hypothetical protein